MPLHEDHPRVLAIFHSGDLSGPLLTLEPRLELLARDGHVELLFPWPAAGLTRARRTFTSSVVPYRPMLAPHSLLEALRLPLRTLRELRLLRRAIARARAEVVVVATSFVPAAVVAARLEGVPVIVYAAELVEGAGSVRRRLLARLLVLLTARLSSRVVASSDAVAEQFRGALVLSPEVDLTVPTERLDPPGGEPRLAVVGAISRGRGQDVAVRALALVRRRFPDATLLVAGEPHPRRADLAFADELRQLRDSLGLRHAVVFLGPVIEIAALYSIVDAVVVPTRIREGFGRVAFEAVKAGVPVIVTPTGAAADLLRDGVEALVVPPDDPEALAAAAVRVLADRELTKRLTEGAARRVAELPDSARAFAELVRATARRQETARTGPDRP